MTTSASILIVEDDLVVASSIKASLERMGYRVPAIADSRQDALALTAKHAPDLVLMDIVLRAGDDGIETANEIRLQFHTPVLYVTGYADDAIIERAKASEAVGYILKPFDQRELKANIELALSRTRTAHATTQRLATMFETAPDGLIGVSLEGTIQQVNQRLLTMFGYERSELIGQPLEILLLPTVRVLHAHHRARYAAAATPRLMGGGIAALAGQRKDGTAVPVEISLSQIETERGLMTVAAVRDVTARREIEAHLELARSQLSARVDSLPDFALSLDRAGTIRFITQPPPGRTIEQAIGTSWVSFVSSDQHAKMNAALDSVFSTGRPMALEISTTRPDGTVHSYACHLAPISQEGDPGVVLIAHDITEVRRVEAQVRAEEERFRATFEQAAVGIAHIGRDQVIQRVNARFGEILGVAHSDLLECGLLAFVHADEHDRAHAATVAVLEGKQSVVVREERWIGRDGARWLNVTRSLVRDPAGEPAYMVVIAEDIESRKQAEQQFHEAQKLSAVGQLAGGIAHDFNNMLTVILTYSELGASMLPIDDPRRVDLGQIERAAGRATQLTNQLMTFSRREALAPRVQDLSAVVRSNEQIMRRLIPENIELRFVLPAEPMLVTVDPGQITQVLFNLVINARDAIVGQGRITVEIASSQVDETVEMVHGSLQDGRYVTLAVTDTGGGMDRETRDRIFEPFFTTKPRGRGTGLGLATVFGVVKQCGGGISVESEPGHGSCFTIFLPGGELEPMAPDAHITQPIRMLGGSETILVVEDDPHVREATIQILRRSGYRVLEAASAGEALLIWETEATSIELVITDVVMPQLSGPQIAARLRRDGVAPRLLFMSGYPQGEGDDGELDPDAAFISKPLTPKALLAKVRGVLDA